MKPRTSQPLPGKIPYKISPAAADNIISIFVFGIETFGREQAEKYREGMERTLELIADMPLLGRQYRGEVRRFLFGRHVIFYESKDDHIYVLRIRHSAVDPERHL